MGESDIRKIFDKLDEIKDEVAEARREYVCTRQHCADRDKEWEAKSKELEDAQKRLRSLEDKANKAVGALAIISFLCGLVGAVIVKVWTAAAKIGGGT